MILTYIYLFILNKYQLYLTKNTLSIHIIFFLLLQLYYTITHAKIIANQKANYLLYVKDNHPTFKKDIADYIHDKDLQNTLKVASRIGVV